MNAELAQKLQRQQKKIQEADAAAAGGAGSASTWETSAEASTADTGAAAGAAAAEAPAGALTWESKPEESTADAVAESLLLDNNEDFLEIGPTSPEPKNDKTSPARSSFQEAQHKFSGLAAKAGSQIPSPSQGAQGSRPGATAPGGASSRPNKFDAERERTKLAGDCATRWPRLLQASSSSSAQAATKTISEEHLEADLRTIRADVQRTRGSDPAFKDQPEMHTRLEQLLVSFCSQEGVRYMQGLHEVAAVFAFLQAMAPSGTLDDASTLALFSAFVQKFMPYFYEGEAFVALHISLLFFRQLILYHHPDLHNALDDFGVSPFMYATPWFITLFSTRTPMNVILRLWDRYIDRADCGFMPFLAVSMLVGEKQAILASAKDEAHRAVGKAGIKNLQQLDEVWAKAEAMHTQTPKSFTMRLSKVIEAIMKKQGALQEDDSRPWSERVLGQVERERRFVVRPEEVAAYCVRLWRMTAGEPARPADIQKDTSERTPSKDAPEGAAEAAPVHTPDPALPKLRFMLLDLRPKEEHSADCLPMALHFHPPCLRKLAATAKGRQPRLERLAASLSIAVSSAVSNLTKRGDGSGDGPEEGDVASPESGTAVSTIHSAAARVDGVGKAQEVDPAVLGEVFDALQQVAAQRWGEDWVSESASGHLVLLGGAADAAELVTKSDGSGSGVVAPLYEALTEHLSLARVSVVLGGCGAVSREAAKRGYDLTAAVKDEDSGSEGRSKNAVESVLGSAWKRVQAASESLPEAEPTRARLSGIWGLAGEAVGKFASKTTESLKESAKVVRQHASEGASAVKEQAKESAVTWSNVWHQLEKLDRDSNSGAGADPAVCYWSCEAHYARQYATHEIQKADEDGEVPKPGRRILTDAVLKLTEQGELILLENADSGDNQDPEAASEPQVSCVFAVEGLQKIGTSQAQPRMLGFYFPNPALPAIAGPPGAPPEGARPAVVAKLLTPEEAKECGRAVAAAAVRRRKTTAARRSAAADEVDAAATATAAADASEPAAPEAAASELAAAEATAPESALPAAAAEAAEAPKAAATAKGEEVAAAAEVEEATAESASPSTA